MACDNIALTVLELCIGFNPFKAVKIYAGLFEPAVIMISFNQTDLAAEPVENLIYFLRLFGPE